MPVERIKIVNSELSADPLTRGYSTMTDQQAADDLNTAYRSVDVKTVKSSAVLEATILSEYSSLTAANKNLYNSMLAMGELDPSGTNTKAVFAGLFGSGTTTRANLLALSTMTVSRAVELLGDATTVTASLVSTARSYTP